MTKEEAIDLWDDAQDWGCTCHISPPCAYCVDGFSLDLDEYLVQYYYEEEEEVVDNKDDAYDRAMDMLK